MTISFSKITTLYLALNFLLQSYSSRDLRYYPANATRRVHGGIPVKLGELPYQVGFKARHDKDPKRFYTYCGGAIIGKAKILSAAHCFVDEGTRYVPCPRRYTSVRSLADKYAVAATTRSVVYFEQEKYEQWRTLRSVAYPNNYKFPHNDLAVLFVTKSFQFNDLVKPIRIAQKFLDYEGLSLVSGYGEISHTIGSDSLLKAQLLLFPYDYCSKLNPTKDMEKLICTSLIGTDIGRGDSGGPLVYIQHASDRKENDRKTLIGIASGTIGDQNSVFQSLPQLGDVHPPIIVNDKSFVNDPDSLSMFAKYEDWNPRVINGWEAKLGDVPYQISLKYLVKKVKRIYMNFCGAAIIAPRKVLSAAHCFDQRSLSNCHKFFFPGKAKSSSLRAVYAVAGTLRNVAQYQSDGQWRKLERVEFPKTYDFPTDDIAVVIPKSEFFYNDYVGPIPIASRNIDYDGKCLVSGYGRIGSKRDSSVSPVLLLGHLVIIPTNLCRVEDLAVENFVCTSPLMSDVGKGDSGGPLVCSETGDPNEEDNGLLVGVVSGTIPGSISICTRISRYQSFINSVNSVSMLMNKYNFESCTAIIIILIYKTFVLL